MFWLIREDVGHSLHEARKATQPTAEDLREMHEALRPSARQKDGPQSLTVAGDTAEIAVEGVLTHKPDFWAWLLDLPNTTYADLLEGIEAAKSNPAVRRVEVHVDSPGGEWNGLVDVIDALTDLRATKSVRVIAASAHSAAYGIAAAAGPIEARSRASMFGSVGVAVSFWLSDYVLDLTNTASPDKRPDVRTEEGQAVVRRELDAIYHLFAEAIATGRGTTVEAVSADFGRGASFVAEEAQRRGMIDSVAGLRSAPPAPGPGASTTAPPTASAATHKPGSTAAATETSVMKTSASTAPSTMDEEEEHEDELPPEEEEERDPDAMDGDEPEDETAPDAADPEEEDKDEVAPPPPEEEEEDKDKDASASRTTVSVTVLDSDEAQALVARVDHLTARARQLLGREDASISDALNELATSRNESWLNKQLETRAISLTDKQREHCMRLASKGEHALLLEHLDALNAPPTQDPMKGARRSSSKPSTRRQAINAIGKQLADENPHLDSNAIHRLALNQAREEHPDLFVDAGKAS